MTPAKTSAQAAAPTARTARVRELQPVLILFHTVPRSIRVPRLLIAALPAAAH